MKKISLFTGILLIIFALAGCGLFEREQPVTISLTHNLDTSELEDDGPRLSVKPADNIVEGQEVMITASTYPGYHFVEWQYENGDQFSNLPVTRFVVEESVALVAIYEPYEVGYFNVIAYSNDVDEPLHFSIEGPYQEGTILTITAPDVEGYTFDHFRDSDTGLLITREQHYTFTVTKDRHIEAVYAPGDRFFVVFETNVEGVSPIVSEAGPYEEDDVIVVEAPLIDGYGFIHWQTDDGTIISEERIINYTVEGAAQLIAIYNETSLVYETGFEDVSKPSFARATIETRGYQWIFHEALIGTSHLDQKEGNKSVRLRNGYIESVFAIEHLERITFKYGTFGESEPTSVRLLVSADKVSWYLLKSSTAQEAWRTFEHIFSEEDFPAHGPSGDEPLYIRISHNPANPENQINIDNLKIYVSEENDNIQYPGEPTIKLDDDIQLAYSLDEVWEGTACEAFYLTEEAQSCQVDGIVDTSTIGEYDITYYFTAGDVTVSETVTKVVLRDASYLTYDYQDSYYAGIEGLYGEALLLALRDIIQSNVTLQSYGDARDILQETDRDLNNPDNIILMYTRTSVDSTWDQGQTWNREHVWPQSRLALSSSTSNSNRHIGSDLHNLRAVNPGVNSSRGNKLFGFETTTDTYYPGEDRGNAARIYFYMAVMYAQLTLSDNIPDASTTYTPQGAEHGLLSVLLYFHFDDPVDQYEIIRNDIIYGYQNNRNPFVDHPHLVELIYWDHENLLDWFDDLES